MHKHTDCSMMESYGTQHERPNPANFEPLTVSTSGISIPDGNTMVSLFSGCGGMDLGFIGGFEFLGRAYDQLPNQIVFANDLSAAACKTYRQNFGAQIEQGDMDSVMDRLPSTCDILTGGFPCQDVSINGKRQAANGQRTILYKRMISVIHRLRPKVFVAENVKGLLSCTLGRQALMDFENLSDYAVTWKVCVASKLGVPQKRERLIIIGIRGGTEFRFPLSCESVTAKEAIGDLETMTEDQAIKHIWSKAKRSPEQGSRILKADRPATTMRAEHHGNVQWHYSLPRRISLREQARFQSFPDKFVFPCGMRETERQIGNAVPPVMAWHIARAIHRQVFS